MLETLVVLVITSLLSLVLLQGLSQAMRLESRFGAEIFNAQQGQMYVDWYRQTLAALMPDHRDGPHRFKGRAREMSGLTLSPLDVAAESMQPFTWRLEFDPVRGETSLRYGEGRESREIMAWPGHGGRFTYLDDEGVAHDTWPPFLGTAPQIPKAIRLDFHDADGARSIIGVPRGPVAAYPRRSELRD